MQQKREDFKGFRSGFVAIVGAPNVGKSTLLNTLLGEKVSITSQKPQTTRNRIRGILHRPCSQLVFMDTPGIHRATGPLSTRIVEAALSALTDMEIVLFVADAVRPDPHSEQIVVRKLKDMSKLVILALNKIDLVEKPVLLERIAQWAALYSFEAIVPICAMDGTQTEDLLRAMEAVLPEGPPFFPADSLTDLSERFIAAELIREKVFRLTGQEVPYSTAVTIDSFSEDAASALVKINATIHVERDSQKGIIIGKNGSKLKKIGQEARKDIERMVGAKVFLKLFVRVQKNWSKDTKALQRFGY